MRILNKILNRLPFNEYKTIICSAISLASLIGEVVIPVFFPEYSETVLPLLEQVKDAGICGTVVGVTHKEIKKKEK